MGQGRGEAVRGGQAWGAQGWSASHVRGDPSFLSLKATLGLGQEGGVGVLAHGHSVGFGFSGGLARAACCEGARLAPRPFENSGTGPSGKEPGAGCVLSWWWVGGITLQGVLCPHGHSSVPTVLSLTLCAHGLSVSACW